MIYFVFIIIFLSLIFFFTLKKVIKNFNLNNIKKEKFLFIYFVSFIISIGMTSFVYYFIGSPHLSSTKLMQNKLKKERLVAENTKIFNNAKKELEILKKMLVSQPNDVNILLRIASNSAIIQDTKNEINSLEKIIEIKPLPKIKSLLAQAYLRENQSIVSLKLKKLVDEILAIEPKDPAANYILGLYFEQNGDTNKSRLILLNIYKDLNEEHPWKLIYQDQLNLR